ncbi:winged helix-turn-helix domain-containing protein [Candidatus Woesearchaeota archaeon]|nr:winged helix-turn-helix domain-containing protein [Candidatus Woesearchaeota archaeon]
MPNLSPFDKEREAHDKVLDFLKKNTKGLTTTDIQKELKISRKTLEKHLQVLVRENEIYVKEHGPVRVYYPYIYQTLKSDKLRFRDKIIWFDLIETEKERFLLIKKKKQVKGQWQFESSISIPIEEIGDFCSIISGFGR